MKALTKKEDRNMNLPANISMTKARADLVEKLTKTMRAVYDALKEDAFVAGHQVVPELRESGISLSVAAVEKISRDLCDRGLAESNGHKERPMFRRAAEKGERGPSLRAVDSIQPVAVEDRLLGICTEMLDAMAALRAENAALKAAGCDQAEMATLREKAQQLDAMKKALGVA